MKRIRLSELYEWGILTVLLLVVVHAPFVVSVGTVFPMYEVAIKAWKEIAIGILAAMGIVLVFRHRLWAELFKSWPVRLASLFIVLHLVLAVLMGGHTESVIGGLLIDLRFIAMFLLSYVLVLIRPASIRRVLGTVAAGAGTVVGFGLLQITVLPDDVLRGVGYSRETITPFTTIDSNPDYVRINSTLRGPNPLGAITVIYAALAFAYLVMSRHSASTRNRAAGAMGLIGSIAVHFASFSRSAYIALIAALGIIVVATRQISKRFIISGLAASVILAGGLVLVSSTDWYSNVVLHEDPESTVMSKSNDGHIESFLLGADRTIRQPIGAGIGSTGSASLYDEDASNDTIIENYYFFVSHESGWLGLALFVGLLASVLFALWAKRSYWAAIAVFASGIGLSVIAILLPVWADDTVALIWWALAGVLIAPSGIIGSDYGGRTSK